MEKTTDLIIPGALNTTNANNSTEASNVTRDPEDQAVVIEIALGAGGDREEGDRELTQLTEGGLQFWNEHKQLVNTV